MHWRLRTICGLTTVDIARSSWFRRPTIGQRISRAKAKIAKAHIPYRVPEAHELPDRLRPVLATVYAVFTAGHHAPVGELDARLDLADEAIRLSRVLVELMPDEGECVGLLALTLATNARRRARVDGDGEIVLLADQDRSLWDRDAIAEASALVESVLRRGRPGAYQIQAAIACLHGSAPTYADTDLQQIAELYALLEKRWPTPVVRVNRAVAVAEVDGPRAGLDLLAEIDRNADRTMAPVLVGACRFPTSPRRSRRGSGLVPTGPRVPLQRQRSPFAAAPIWPRSKAKRRRRGPFDPKAAAVLKSLPARPMIGRWSSGSMRWHRQRTDPSAFAKPTTAFVLSGGGSLGAMQAGQLRALFEAGVTPDLVIGISAGALNGAAVAHRPMRRDGRRVGEHLARAALRIHVPWLEDRAGVARDPPSPAPLSLRRPGRPRRSVLAGRRSRPTCRSVRGGHRQPRRRANRLPLDRRSPSGARRLGIVARRLPTGRHQRQQARRRRHRRQPSDPACAGPGSDEGVRVRLPSGHNVTSCRQTCRPSACLTSSIAIAREILTPTHDHPGVVRLPAPDTSRHRDAGLQPDEPIDRRGLRTDRRIPARAHEAAGRAVGLGRLTPA